MLRREHCNQVEGLHSHVDECMRDTGRDLRHIGRLHRHRLLANPILGTPVEQDVSFFGVMHMELGSPTRVCFGNDEGE